MPKTLQELIAPKKPPETGFHYSYILTDNDRGLGEQVPVYAKMNDAITYNNGGAYEKISKHLAEEMRRNELMQSQERGSYLPFYDQITLNFNIRANLRSNPNIYFWNAEPASERPANKTMVMPTLYNNDNNISSMIKDAIGKSPNRIIVPLGLKWPTPGYPHLDHMTALVIEAKSNPPKIFFFNPFGESNADVNRAYKEMAQTTINKLKREIPGLQNAEVINSKATIEYDASSCAVWSEWFINTIAVKSEVPMSGFNDSINLLRANKSEGALNDYIRKRYEDNKRNFSVPAANILQKQPPQPQASVEASPPIRPTPISDKWQRVKNLPNNLPFYRGNSSNPAKSPQFDTNSSNFFNVAQVKVPTGVYEKRNPTNKYQIIVTPHSIGAQLKTNNGTPSNNESLSDYRDRVKQTMEFGADVMNLKHTGFEIASKSPFEDPKIYLSKIQITLEEAQRQNIKVKISAPDQAYLNSIYEKLSRNQNRSAADNKIMDTAKALICGEAPNVEAEVQPQRFRR